MKARGYDVDSRDEAAPSGGPERVLHTASATVLDVTPIADPKADAPVRRLVPFSGIQFLNLEIDAGVLPMISAWFTEEEIDAPTGKRRVLLPLQNEHTPDGSVFHPVTFRPLGPADTLSYSGLEAIEPFLETWIPLPFLRYLGRGPSGEIRLDQGPSNWVRIFVEKPAHGLRAADRLRAVLALDTRLDGTSRADDSPYIAPNVEDALFASTFLFVDDPEQVSGFMSQHWVDAWLRDAVPSVPRGDRFTLAHLARYIGFLKVLAKASAMPRLRFIDSVSQTLPLPTVGLDLVIDVGPSDTTAVLIPRDQPLSPETAAEHAIPLRLRDLGQPVTVHDGAIPTVVEFDNQTFGS
ncbi:MAG: virulence factor SrfB, partial [Hyphomicrobiaceae bacterium]|nr:virulence factor SrfB [Hyphomicrobiaceae bacterium]